MRQADKDTLVYFACGAAVSIMFGGCICLIAILGTYFGGK